MAACASSARDQRTLIIAAPAGNGTAITLFFGLPSIRRSE